jgi:hypothetical protein
MRRKRNAAVVAVEHRPKSPPEGAGSLTLTFRPFQAYHASMSDLTNRIEATQARVNEIAVHL